MAFMGYSSMVKATGTIDCSTITQMYSLFENCTMLTEVPKIINTGKVTMVDCMFQACKALITVEQIDASSFTSITDMFNACTSLENLGGLLNLGKAYAGKSVNSNSCKLNLSSSTKLTHESLMNIINNLYDLAGNGMNTQQLVLGATNLAKLTADEIAIATNKGWTVS